jgi:hypothetical protein
MPIYIGGGLCSIIREHGEHTRYSPVFFFSFLVPLSCFLYKKKTKLDPVQLDTYRKAYVICWWMALYISHHTYLLRKDKVDLKMSGWHILFYRIGQHNFIYNHITKISVTTEEL